MGTVERNQVFISYSHKDEEWLKKLQEVLAPDIRNDRVTVWSDKQIDPGDPWFNKITEAINQARVAVLLVSPYFLASEFILKEELPRLIAAVDDGLTILWIPLFGAFEDQELKARLVPISTYQAVIDPKIPLDKRESSDQIRSLVKVCRKISAMLSPEKSIIQNLPFPSLCSLFKGREKELEKLDEHLRKQGAAAITQPKAISGLGGLGKTRLAVEYAWRRHDEFNAFLFVRADTPSSLSANLAALAGPDILDLLEQKLENEEERKQAVLRWLRQHRGWLLIIDNVDTRESAKAVEELIPKIPGGQVIITSRLTEWSGAVQCSSLDVISLSDAAAFIVDRTKDRHQLPNDQALAEKLAQHLGCLPLALEQAAAYINRRRRTLDEYLKELENNVTKVLEWYDTRIMSYPSSIATTWLTTLDCLGVTEKALLRAISFFATDPIPVAMFKGNTSKIAELVKLWCEETKEEQKQSEPEEAIAELSAFSLVTWSGDSFTIHRMLQEVVKSQTPGERLPQWIEQVTQLVCDYAPKEIAENPSTWGIWDILRPHTETLIEYSDNDSRIQANLKLLDSLSILYYGKGLYSTSLDLAQKALKIAETRFASDSSELAHYYLCCGESLRMLGNLKEAEQMFRKSLAIIERIHGPQSERYADDLNYLAMALEAEGKHGEAETLYREAIKIYETIPSSNEHSLSKCIGNLGCLLNTKGDYNGAEPLLRRALAIMEKVLGQEHPHAVASLISLAIQLWSKGEYVEAEPLFRRALAIYEKVLGKEHPYTARSIDCLAVLLHSKGDYTEAEPLFRRALDIREKVLGKECLDTAASLSSLAELLRNKGDYEDAEPLFRRALAIYEKVLGKEHPHMVSSLNNLALLLQDTNRLAEAENLIRCALRIDEQSFGENNPAVAIRLNNLAQLLQDTNRLAEAEPLMRRHLEIFLKFTCETGHPHLHLRAAVNNYATLLHAMGRSAKEITDNLAKLGKRFGVDLGVEQANEESHMRQALAISEMDLGKDHPDTITARFNLGQLLRDKGDHKGAAPLYRQLIEIYEELLKENVPILPQILSKIAISHNELAFHTFVPAKDWKEAGHYYKKAIELFGKVPDPIEAANSEMNLQTMYHLSGQQVNVERVKALTRILEDAKDKRAEKGHKILKELSE